MINKTIDLIVRAFNALTGHTRHQIIIRLINDNAFKQITEVGVWKGETAVKVLKACPDILVYTCIDSYQGEWEKYKIQAVKDLKDRRVTWMFMTSAEAGKKASDKSQDLVYIDASHDYESVMDDILTWLPKVKPGGILCGDDYGLSHFGVMMAVHEILGDVQVIKRMWVYRKPVTKT